MIVSPSWNVGSIQGAFDARANRIRISAGDYNLASNVTFSSSGDTTTGWLQISPNIVQSGAGLIDARGLTPDQTAPTMTFDMMRVYYGADFPTGYNNIYQRGSAVFVGEGGPGRVVSLWSYGKSVYAGKSVWATNFGAKAGAVGGIAIMGEWNFGPTVDGGLAYGIAMVCASNYIGKVAIRLGSNNPGAGVNKFITIDNSTQNLVQESLFEVGAINGTLRGLYWRGTFGAYEIDIPGFGVLPGENFGARLQVTPSNTSTRLGVTAITQSSGTPSTNCNFVLHSLGTGSIQFSTNGASNLQFQVGHVASAVDRIEALGSTGGLPLLRARGSTADASAVIRGKGAGGVRLQDGASATKIDIDTTGIAFFGGSTSAQSTGWGAITGVSADKATKDGTTATLPEAWAYIKAMRDELVAKNFIAA